MTHFTDIAPAAMWVLFSYHSRMDTSAGNKIHFFIIDQTEPNIF